jgi:hypothetical protein
MKMPNLSLGRQTLCSLTFKSSIGVETCAMKFLNSVPSRSAFIALTSVLVLVGCSDELATPTDVILAELDVSRLPPGVHAVITVPGLRIEGGGTTARLHLIPIGGEYEVASFQGELEWSPDEFEITEVEQFENILVAWNLVRPGLIRFAGVAVEGIGVEPFLRLNIETSGKLSSEMFEIRIEELIKADGFEDLLPEYASGSHPTLARSLVGVMQ